MRLVGVVAVSTRISGYHRAGPGVAWGCVSSPGVVHRCKLMCHALPAKTVLCGVCILRHRLRLSVYGLRYSISLRARVATVERSRAVAGRLEPRRLRFTRHEKAQASLCVCVLCLWFYFSNSIINTTLIHLVDVVC